MPAKESIQVRSQRELDQFNDPIGPEPEWRTIPGATVAPRGSQDYEQRGAIVISGFMVAVPSSVELENTDEFRIRGQVYQVEGEIGDYGRRKIFYTMRAN